VKSIHHNAPKVAGLSLGGVVEGVGVSVGVIEGVGVRVGVIEGVGVRVGVIEGVIFG
jgi:hypothetical protein